MHSSEPTVVSIWDAANIFEYATARFIAIRMALEKSQVPKTLVFRRKFVQHIIWEAEKFVFLFINICATSNTSPALPEYLNDVVKMLTEWQVGLLDDKDLFHTFSTNRSDIAGNLMSRYRVVSTFAYSWWKDRFDLIPFEMPHRITLEEVQELYQAHASQMPSGYMLLPDVRRSAGMGGPDPLIVNLRGLREDLEMLGDHLQLWLSRKTDEGRVTLEAKARLEGPVDNFNDAMAVSQQLLDAGWMDEDEDYSNIILEPEG
ncbi:hypothetical protein P692DRAFT_201812142 [Suillus brevipes Sb2]|nr:hypothetical protein P692DRAFT_201812142 [Suillus brevipes Sb2]